MESAGEASEAYMNKVAKDNEFSPAVFEDTVFDINTRDKTISHFPQTRVKSYKDLSDKNEIEFLEGLTGYGTVINGYQILVKDTLDQKRITIIKEIFSKLPYKTSRGGRRPSRKYKKSKRVLRRKSRSTRRR
jgi:peptide subunit release factor 1 (eRF1)